MCPTTSYGGWSCWVWQLHDTVSAHDAGYLALAESLNCALVTADARLSRAPGAVYPITVVPR